MHMHACANYFSTADSASLKIGFFWCTCMALLRMCRALLVCISRDLQTADSAGTKNRALLVYTYGSFAKI